MPVRSKNKIENTLEAIYDEVGGVKDMVSSMMTLNSTSPVPLGFKRVIKDTFKCMICHCVPIKPPVIVTKCCKQLLGCQDCVSTWFSGDDALTKSCPLCRSERGYSDTMVLRGISEFLTQIGKVITPPHDDTEESTYTSDD